VTLTNHDIAELLARTAEEIEEVKRRAYRRAARAALSWFEEASDLLEEGRSLTELYAIGPGLEKRLKGWIEDPPQLDESPPESRAGFTTMSVARRIVAAHPQWRGTLMADLQMHTTYSDGTTTIEEMATASRALGHRFVAITDHSVGLKIAGGMSKELLVQQAREIELVNERMLSSGLRVLHALEMNIAPSGEGDMEPEVLAGLDLVLGSFHSNLRGAEDQTERYVAALRNPTFHVLGHPRGRMYGSRTGLRADWPRVFAEAVRQHKAVEIDCNPNRQDLNIAVMQLAADFDVYVSIGTDAHSTWELNFIDLGIATAIEAGVPRDRILNYMPADEVVQWAHR
jgi:histidinol phosphatase-like PHP family hydrolase